jgi:flagellar biosynthesis component FlhA
LPRDSIYCPACGRSRFDGHEEEGFVSKVPTVFEALSKALAPFTYSQDGHWPNKQAERMPTEQMVILGVFILVLIVGILPTLSSFAALFLFLLVASGLYWIWKHAWTEVRKESGSEPAPTGLADETDEHDETPPKSL